MIFILVFFHIILYSKVVLLKCHSSLFNIVDHLQQIDFSVAYNPYCKFMFVLFIHLKTMVFTFMATILELVV